MKKKNFSDNDVVGNHIAVGSYLQVIQWIFFGSAKVDTISRSVQLDLHVNKSSTSGVVDGMEYDDVWRVRVIQKGSSSPSLLCALEGGGKKAFSVFSPPSQEAGG